MIKKEMGKPGYGELIDRDLPLETSYSNGIETISLIIR